MELQFTLTLTIKNGEIVDSHIGLAEAKGQDVTGSLIPGGGSPFYSSLSYCVPDDKGDCWLYWIDQLGKAHKIHLPNIFCR